MITASDFSVTYTPGGGYSARLKNGKADNVTVSWGEEVQSKWKEHFARMEAEKEAAPPIERAELTDGELSELAEKFNPHDMTQEEYDEFLETLVDKKVLTQQEIKRAGYNGLVVGRALSDLCFDRLTDCTGMSMAQILSMKSDIFLFDVNGMGGDTLSWTNIMDLRFSGERDSVYHALHNVLSNMDDYRGVKGGH